MTFPRGAEEFLSIAAIIMLWGTPKEREKAISERLN
jgi:hypothetical protein